MALTDDEAELVTVAQKALPNGGADVPPEMLAAFAREIDPARQQVKAWRDACLITRATGVDLDALGKDLGAARQNGEGDPAFRQRMRSVAPAITPNALLGLAQDIVTAFGVTSPAVAIVQLRPDAAHICTDTTTGRQVAYVSRGYRAEHIGRPHVFIVILPYGTDAPTGQAVLTLLQRQAGAGVVVRVEIRGTP